MKNNEELKIKLEECCLVIKQRLCRLINSLEAQELLHHFKRINKEIQDAKNPREDADE